MACPKKEISELLPLYINRRIGAQECRQVEEHLLACEDCKKEFGLLHSFAATFKAPAPGFAHVEEEKLVAYCGDRFGLGSAEVGVIEDHLRTCSNCAREAKALSEMNRSLEDSSPASKNAGAYGVVRRLTQKISIVRPRLAFASLILILVIVGAFIYFRRLNVAKQTTRITSPQQETGKEPKPAPGRPPDQPRENLTAQYMPPKFTLREMTEAWRGQKTPEENHIKLSAQETAFTLSFLVAITTDPAVGYDLEILDEGGSMVVARKGVKSADAVGHFQETFERERFQSGTYLLRVREINRKDFKTMAEYLFPFKLTIK